MWLLPPAILFLHPLRNDPLLYHLPLVLFQSLTHPHSLLFPLSHSSLLPLALLPLGFPPQVSENVKCDEDFPCRTHTHTRISAGILIDHSSLHQCLVSPRTSVARAAVERLHQHVLRLEKANYSTDESALYLNPAWKKIGGARRCFVHLLVCSDSRRCFKITVQ